MGYIWLIQVGILGILDKFLFTAPAPQGQKNVGPMIWAIVVLVFAGIAALAGLVSLVGSMRMFGYLSHAPVLVLMSFLSSACQIALSVFLILGGISRLCRSTPGMGVLKLIFGIVCVVLWLSSFAWMRMF